MMKTYFNKQRRISILSHLLLLCSIFLMVLEPASAAVKSHFNLKSGVSTIALGDAFEAKLELEIIDDEDVTAVNPPDFEGAGFKIVNNSRSTQSSYRNINGRSESRKTYVFSYLLKATRLGALTIPRAKATVDGEIIFSKSENIKVIEADTDSENEAFPNKPFFLRASLSKENALIGEQVFLELKIYAQESIRVRDIDFPEMKDFWIEKIDEDRMEGQKQIIQGREYTVFTAHKAILFPLKAGELVIPSTSMTVEVQQGFFQRGRSYVLKSNAQKIGISLPPKDGRPLAFSTSNIGQWNFVVRLEKNTTEVGQAVKLEMKIRGIGRASAVQLPKIEGLLKNVRTFPPNTDEKNQIKNGLMYSEKKVEILLQPLNEGFIEIPALEFNFYNPKARKYEQKKSKAQRLRVISTGQQQPQVSKTNKEKALSGDNQKMAQLKLRPLHVGEALVLNSKKKNKGIKWWIILVISFSLLILRIFIEIFMKAKTDKVVSSKALRKEWLAKIKAASDKDLAENQLLFWDVMSYCFGEEVKAMDAQSLADYLENKHGCENITSEKISDWSLKLQELLYSPVNIQNQEMSALHQFLTQIVEDKDV